METATTNFELQKTNIFLAVTAKPRSFYQTLPPAITHSELTYSSGAATDQVSHCEQYEMYSPDSLSGRCWVDGGGI